jgi:hypothetical protein
MVICPDGSRRSGDGVGRLFPVHAVKRRSSRCSRCPGPDPAAGVSEPQKRTLSALPAECEHRRESLTTAARTPVERDRQGEGAGGSYVLTLSVPAPDTVAATCPPEAPPIGAFRIGGPRPVLSRPRCRQSGHNSPRTQTGAAGKGDVW